MKLTKTAVDALVAGGRDFYHWDAALPGFGLKVTPAGKKIYLVQYRPKAQSSVTRRYTIGRHGAPWRTEAARDAAETLLARVRLGEDPFEADRQTRKLEAAATIAESERKEREASERFTLVVDKFIERYAKPKNRRWDEAARILNSTDLTPWKDRAISSITKRDIVSMIDRVSQRSNGGARLLFAHLRKLFGWCVDRLYLEQSPFVGLKGPSLPRPRDRTLTDDELVLIWRASGTLTHPFGPLLRLLMLTGQRREEVGGMRWSEIDLSKAEWIIPAERAKNAQSHVVDLSTLSLKELRKLRVTVDRAASRRATTKRRSIEAQPPESDFVFTTNNATSVSGHSKTKTALDEAVGALRLRADPALAVGQASLVPWRIHDLRRTAATGMARLGFPPHVVEAVLNHRSGVRGGLVAVYQHYDHRSERRAALAAWDKHIAGLLIIAR